MACSNCFNGCVDIISDQCVRYTGLDVPALGILTGDPLSRVEESLTTFLVSALNGTGIKPYVDPAIICALVNANLPACGELTIVDLITGLIKSVCDLQEQIDVIIVDVAAIEATLATLNSTYTTSCLTGTIDAESTHSVLQALITNFCALVASLPSTYVALADIDQIIADWIAIYNSSSLISNKMIPYAVVPYFGSISYFDATGGGLGDWANIYLCNGNNGTPDLRGRTLVGATTGLPGPAFNPAVDPAISGNPTYSLSTLYGNNTITLSPAQMPTHTHTAASVVSNATHTHFTVLNDIPAETLTALTPIKYDQSDGGGQDYTLKGVTGTANIGLTSPNSVNPTVATTNASAGSSEAHNNVQPSIGCYYIIYIP
jgi:microcystin-dependent protein